jgi:hypothetical protein
VETVRSLDSNLAYLKELVGAGLDGIGSARREIDGDAFTSPLRPVGWTPAAIGTTIGMFTVGLTGNRKSASRMATGGLVGSVMGYCVGLAWASRRSISPAVRAAVRRVNAVRDARWHRLVPLTTKTLPWAMFAV